jgi:hypothetical protein
MGESLILEGRLTIVHFVTYAAQNDEMFSYSLPTNKFAA